MKLILYQDLFAITAIDFVPGPVRCWIELGHLDFAVVWSNINPEKGFDEMTRPLDDTAFFLEEAF